MLHTVNSALTTALPAPPQTIEELGIPPAMVLDLALLYLRAHGSGGSATLRGGLKLSRPVVESILEHLRQRQFIEVKGTLANELLFSLTTAGKQYAAERAEACCYAGPAPVPLDQYTRMVRAQRTYEPPTVAGLREAYSDLVISDSILDRIGQAFVSGRPLFIYGPPGGGKTSILERFPRLFGDSVLVPYAVEVDGYMISVFDPRVHRPIAEPSNSIDERWVRCFRPCIMTAGELVPSMLNLRLDEHTGVYAAPLQMKANNGVLRIDDLGRQAMAPSELLNRWILPLDRRVDYLSLRFGLTFPIPFEVIVAFATNLDPASLADEAFLRRVPNKIYVGPVSDEMFDRIFERVLQRMGQPFEHSTASYLRSLCRQRNASGLRACYPRDMCEIMLAASQYKREPLLLSRENLDLAVETYFTHSALESR